MVVVCILLGVLITVGVVTVGALLRAKDGFEDAEGFHLTAPKPASKAIAVPRAAKVQVSKQRPVPAGLELAAD